MNNPIRKWLQKNIEFKTFKEFLDKNNLSITELYRVLKSGGVLLVEDLNKDASHFFATYFKLDHPPEAYFTWDEFTNHLEETGFDILEQKRIISKGVGSFLCLKN